MFDPNNEPEIAGDTDDLAAFETLMFGKAKTSEPVEDSNDNDTVADPVEPTAPVTEDSPDEDETPEEEKPKKVNKVQERINKVLEKERLANERADALAKEVEELRRAKDTAPTPVLNQKDGPDPDELNDDGSSKYPLGELDPTFIRDLTRHEIQKERETLRQQDERARVEREIQNSRNELNTQWKTKLDAVADKYEDFMEKTIGLEDTFEGIDPQVGDYLVQTIKSLDHGPDVLYYFANNLEEAQKFVQMGPLAATLALGEYNAMFKGQSRKETKVSNAPPPPQLNKGATPRKAVAADTDDLDAFSQVFFSKKR